ncbi:MAG: DUF637 domain-containing protein, partial [Epsilonproteobacteria bacterium]|nr:DUF637 domain-containing protein [Campylobacterota bacterium]
DKLDFANNAGREVMQASVSTAIYGGDFKDNVIAAVGDAVAGSCL